MCCLPLCTAMVKPTNSGSTVERRDQVFTGRLSLVARTASIFFIRCISTNGPFLMERAISIYLLILEAATHNHAVGTLVATGAETFGRHAPRADRVAACGGLAFAAAVRMVDRVHRHAAHRRTDATPALGARLADGTQEVFAVANFAQGSSAIHMHLANFTGAQAQLRIKTFTRQQLHRSAG